MKDFNTEQLILDSAKKVFILKGKDGARMQEIADEAGINKSLVHYYFRNKDKLFEAVFTEIFQGILPGLAELINGKESLFEKIQLFVASYIDILNENPMIPAFILHELNREPLKVAKLIKNSGINPMPIIIPVNEEIEKGNIQPVDPFHLIVNLLSMCIFPFVARPILQHVIFDEDKEIYNTFIEQRKNEIPEFIINSIRKK